MSFALPPQVAEMLTQEKVDRLPKQPVYQASKRILDFLLSVLLLVLLAPLWLVLLILIKLDSKGPAYYTQSVVGLNGAEFTMYKFRSMVPNSRREDHTVDLERNFLERIPTGSDEKGPIYKTALTDRSRITRIGRLLRRLSLDELPQLWNVVRGEMSLVGPRPALPEEARLYDDAQKGRFAVRPGMTGLYQVTARHRVPIEEMIRMDLEYIQEQSFWLDCKILLKTPIAMLGGV
jgi:lipopolysaccharide/colanic/teichoic acid biosynthesis glycosyltransferase